MNQAKHVPRVVFAHGKESGPWGSKIRHLAAIAEAPSTTVEQRALISELDEVIVELNGVMVEDADSVYALRQQQLDLGAQVQAALTNVAAATTEMRAALSDIEAYTVAQAASASEEAETLANAGRTLLILVTRLLPQDIGVR